MKVLLRDNHLRENFNLYDLINSIYGDCLIRSVSDEFGIKDEYKFSTDRTEDGEPRIEIESNLYLIAKKGLEALVNEEIAFEQKRRKAEFNKQLSTASAWMVQALYEQQMRMRRDMMFFNQGGKKDGTTSGKTDPVE